MTDPKVTRPLLPRQLALRLRGIYEKLRDRRCACARAEALIHHCQRQLCAYEVDPVRFAWEYFPGSAVDSFPVIARIQRARETLACYCSEIAGLKSDLAATEAQCIRTEQEIAAQLTILQRSRSSWCRWPDKPHDMAWMQTWHLHHFHLRPRMGPIHVPHCRAQHTQPGEGANTAIEDQGIRSWLALGGARGLHAAPGLSRAPALLESNE